MKSGDRRALARALSYAESTRSEHRGWLDQFWRSQGEPEAKSLRLAFTGPPGAGKSTLIECVGQLALGAGHRVAVLPVDPSSEASGGSLLGDETRMVGLATHERAFVRPSAARRMLGGLAAHTLESVELCELAGYDWVFVESVGVGQSEIDVQWVADAVVLVVPPLGGDELQGLKRGMNEVCDVVVVNKADGEGRAAAARSASDAAAAFGVLRRAPPPVFVLSARDGTGVAPFFEWARNRAAELCDDPIRLAQKRRTQRRAYFDRVVRAALWARLEALQARPEHAELHEQVASGVLRAPAAAQALINVLLAPVDKTPG